MSVPVHHVLDAAPDLPPEAPVVILGGSLGSTLEMWDPQVPALAKRFRVLRYDTRGHGRSPVPEGPYEIDDLVDDLVALMDRLGIECAHLVGLSLGGMTMLRLAARHPGRVDRLAVLCTSAMLGPPQGWADRAHAVRQRGTGAVAAAVVERWFTDGFRARHPDVVADAVAMVAATPAEGYAACCGAIERMDLRADLPRISAPTLAIAGLQDLATPPDHLEQVALGVAQGRLTVVDQAAHLANMEQPHAVSAALLAHLGDGAMTREAPMGDVDRRKEGAKVRREVLGDAHVDAAVSRTTSVTEPFQDFITRYAWGDVWSRPGLDRRTRSMLTLALLTALGHEHELEMHVRAALRNGVSHEEITEVLLHTAVYAGVPAANRAFAVAQRVLAEQPAQPEG